MMNIQEIKEYSEKNGLSDVLAMIEYLESKEGRQIAKVGTSTLGRVEGGVVTDEIAKQLALNGKSFYLGSANGSILPLEWLEKNSDIFQNQRLANGFNDMCNAILSSLGKIAKRKENEMCCISASELPLGLVLKVRTQVTN